MKNLMEPPRKPFYKKPSSLLMVIFVVIILVMALKAFTEEQEQDRVTLYDKNDIKVELTDRLNDDIPYNINLEIENGTDSSVVIGIENLKINGKKHTAQSNDGERLISETLSQYIKTGGRDGEDYDREYGQPIYNIISYQLNTPLSPAQYDDSISKGTTSYEYEQISKRKRPYDLNGKLEFSLSIYTTKEASIKYAASDNNGNLKSLKKIDEVEIEIPEVK